MFSRVIHVLSKSLRPEGQHRLKLTLRSKSQVMSMYCHVVFRLSVCLLTLSSSCAVMDTVDLLHLKASLPSNGRGKARDVGLCQRLPRVSQPADSTCEHDLGLRQWSQRDGRPTSR